MEKLKKCTWSDFPNKLPVKQLNFRSYAVSCLFYLDLAFKKLLNNNIWHFKNINYLTVIITNIWLSEEIHWVQLFNKNTIVNTLLKKTLCWKIICPEFELVQIQPLHQQPQPPCRGSGWPIHCLSCCWCSDHVGVVVGGVFLHIFCLIKNV